MNRALYVPLALFAAATLAPSARADTVLFDASLASPPGVYFGTGNSNSGFTVDQSTIEIGLSAIERFQGPVTPNGNTYTVPTGDTTNIAGGSAWGVDFSINLAAFSGTLTLGNIDALLTYTDATTGVTSALVPVNVAGSGAGSTCYNGAVDTTCAIASDYAAQNSDPGSLLSSLGDPNFNDNFADTYTVTLNVYDCSGALCQTGLLGSDTIVVNAVPEPDSLAIFGGALVALGLLWNRRRAGGGVI